MCYDSLITHRSLRDAKHMKTEIINVNIQTIALHEYTNTKLYYKT